MGKSVGLSLTGRWLTGAVGRPAFIGQRCTERWRWRGSGSTVLWLRRCSVRSLRTTLLRRSMHATSTAAERGQVPEREALGPSEKFWRVRPLGEPPTITTRQKFLRADPGLEAVERGWNGLRPSAPAATPRTAPWGYPSARGQRALWATPPEGCFGGARPAVLVTHVTDASCKWCRGR